MSLTIILSTLCEPFDMDCILENRFKVSLIERNAELWSSIGRFSGLNVHLMNFDTQLFHDSRTEARSWNFKGLHCEGINSMERMKRIIMLKASSPSHVTVHNVPWIE